MRPRLSFLLTLSLVPVACASRPPGAATTGATVLPAPSPPTETEAALAAADGWFALVGSGDYAGCWKVVGAGLRAKIDEATFDAQLRKGHEDLGALRSRGTGAVTFGNDPPDGAPGRYAAIAYDAHYETMPEATDHVLLHLEDDGRWRVVGFFTKPAACRDAESQATTLPAPPAALGLDPFYRKYVDAGGLPIVSSSRASDRALLTARTIVLGMMRKRPDVLARLVAEDVHVTVISPAEQTLEIPEYRALAGTPTDTPGMDWNERARGLGGSLEDPSASGSEENLLCMPCDRYRGGNVLVHEFAHIIELVGLVRDQAFRRALHDAFANATAKKLFQAPYPATNEHEYWAVGVQSWFDANVPHERRSRAELKAADPPLAALVGQVFEDDDRRFACGVVEDLPVAAPTSVPVVAKTHACPAGMVALPGGSFPFGAAEVVRPFCMDATEVTVEAYAACVRAGRCTAAATDVKVEGPSAEDLARYSAMCNGNRADRRHHPVNCVDWNQATKYCAAQGKRLPTEQEWEWAARGASAATAYPWGFAVPKDQLCWSGSSPMASTCEVGSHPAGDTPQGIHDLAGDVAEWTADTLDDGSPVVKGSGFIADRAGRVRVQVRDDGSKDFRAHIVGFRCVR